MDKSPELKEAIKGLREDKTLGYAYHTPNPTSPHLTPNPTPPPSHLTPTPTPPPPPHPTQPHLIPPHPTPPHATSAETLRARGKS